MKKDGKGQQKAPHQWADKNQTNDDNPKKQKNQSQATAEIVSVVRKQEECVKDEAKPNKVCVYNFIVIYTLWLFNITVIGCQEQDCFPVSLVGSLILDDYY